MRAKLPVVLLISLCCSLISRAAFGNNLQDSLIIIENIYVYYLTELDKAQQIINRLRELSDEKRAFDHTMNCAQADLYFNTGKYRLASYYFERRLGYDKVKTNRKFLMGLLSTMLECHRMNNNLEKTMKTAIALLKITEADKIKEETGKAYQYMGEVFSARKDYVQSKKYFEMAEQLLKESEHIPYLYHFYMAYADILVKNNQYGQALTVVGKARQILNRVATDPDMKPKGYEAFETSRFQAFAAEILAKNGKEKEAEEYYREFTSQHSTNSIENKILIVPYLLITKRYNEAISISLEREDYLRQCNDTVGDNMLAVKNYLVTAYEELGMKDRVIEHLRQQLSVEEQLRSRQLSFATQELAVIYEKGKKDAELKERKAEVKSHHSLVLVLSIISLLALIIMVITICNQRNMKKKNRLMAKQIKEMQILKEYQSNGNKGGDGIEEPDLFTQLERLMKHDRLYRDPMCSRELIINRLNIDKNTLLKLQHTNDIENLPDYINGYRLEEAACLLDKEKGLSIEQIAKQAGFGSSRSLQRQFKDKYNISPGEYRKLAKG